MVVTRNIEAARCAVAERCGVPVDVRIRRVPFLLEPEYPDDPEFVEVHLDRMTRRLGKRVGAAGKSKWAELDAKERGDLLEVIKSRKNCGANAHNLALHERGELVGINFTTRQDEMIAETVEHRLNTSTVPSHRLVRWASRFGRSEEVFAIVNRKHFEEGATLNDRKMLSEAAAEAGLDRIAALEYLASDEDLQAVRDEAEHARMMMQKVGAGCAIPYAIVGDQKSSRVQGAQEPEVFAEIFAGIVDPDGALARKLAEGRPRPAHTAEESVPLTLVAAVC